jgi:hypothetical protein
VKGRPRASHGTVLRRGLRRVKARRQSPAAAARRDAGWVPGGVLRMGRSVAPAGRQAPQRGAAAAQEGQEGAADIVAALHVDRVDLR